MNLVLTSQIDPKDYPFKHLIDQQAHLDTDELRHTIKTACHHIADSKGKERLYCDKSQLDANGNWRKPKIMAQAEKRGFTSPIDMVDADKKAEEDTKTALLSSQASQVTALQQQLEDYKALTEERFNKLAKMITQK
jgi:hypothetical protein